MIIEQQVADRPERSDVNQSKPKQGKHLSKQIKQIRIMHTSDVHGALFTHDFIENGPAKGSLAKVYALVKKERERQGNNLILLDGGDVLQGQPTAYYYNFVVPERPHLVARAMNLMGYDAMCIGNHDLETGHGVYDRFCKECNFPILGANVLDENSGAPYFTPYVMIEREGVRVAVLGLLTAAIPHWLPKNLWSGMSVENMLESARKWSEYILNVEKPDLLIGLFHSGWDGGVQTDKYTENMVRLIASQVPGFDIICFGHDHDKRIEVIRPDWGGKVVCVGLWSQAASVSMIDVQLEFEQDKLVRKRTRAQVVSTLYVQDDSVFDFERHFQDDSVAVEHFVNRRIGAFSNTVYGQDAFFGSSALIDFVHQLQLDISGADLSFAAPSFFDMVIHAGDVYVRDMFSLYKYENMLYVLRMKGHEIKAILEMSYRLWTNRMTNEDDHLLLIDNLLNGGKGYGFVNLTFNFDSAAGIRYQVDVRRPDGEKVLIECMADGSVFDLEREYLVATNSYRANGGGELFTIGAGLTHEELMDRIVWCSERDLRYYFMEYVERHERVSLKPMNHWCFIPEDWVIKATKRDRELLFGWKRLYEADRGGKNID